MIYTVICKLSSIIEHNLFKFSWIRHFFNFADVRIWIQSPSRPHSAGIRFWQPPFLSPCADVLYGWPLSRLRENSIIWLFVSILILPILSVLLSILKLKTVGSINCAQLFYNNTNHNVEIDSTKPAPLHFNTPQPLLHFNNPQPLLHFNKPQPLLTPPF